MKEYFNKELVLTKKDDDDFENSAKCWIFDNAYVVEKFANSSLNNYW